MLNTLRAYFEDSHPLTDAEFDFITKLFTQRLVAKGEFLLREGEVATHGAFVAKGCLRSYAIDQKGKEHIIQFAPENWWLSNMESINSGTPSTYFIDSIEETHVLLIDKQSFVSILQKVPSFARSFQSGFQKHAAAKDKRIIATLAASAEERYNNFLETYPSIALRVPQHMLASYLGITPETLSRIPKKQSQKK